MPIEIESPEELGYDTIANNLSESSCADMTLADLEIDGDVSRLLLQYGDHMGLPRLREHLTENVLDVEDVLITSGAAPALFIVATALLNADEHLVVVRPNYATNLETPRALGADISFVDLRFEDGWELDLDRIAADLRQDTKLVSVTLPHNPTGTTFAPDTLRALVAMVEAHPVARLLVDETYRELAYDAPLPLAASLSPRVIGVSSVSKTYGLPGLRTGWITCRDAELMTTFLAAKEQILLAGSIIDEELTARVFDVRKRVLPPIMAKAARHRQLVIDWIAGQDVFEVVTPQAGVICFPRIRAEHAVDPDRFYDALLGTYGTYVGPGHWFGQDRRGFRLGYGWPKTTELEAGSPGWSRPPRTRRSPRDGQRARVGSGSVAVDLRHFRSFVVVAEEGNIGRAAKRLFITQPALSRQLQHLEEELGVALLVRGPRGVELTEAGRELLDKARTALEAAESALTIGRPVTPSGRLVVGVALAGQRERWFTLAQAFTATYPEVDVEVRTALSELLQRQLVAGEIDVAIVLEPNHLPALSYQHVRDEPVSVWVHPEHPLAARTSVTLADLDGVPVTLLGGAGGRTSGFNAFVRGLLADAGVTNPFTVPNELAPFTALRTPDALALSVPVGFPPEIVRLELVPEPTMRYEVVHRADAGTAAVRAFAAFAARHRGEPAAGHAARA